MADNNKSNITLRQHMGGTPMPSMMTAVRTQLHQRYIIQWEKVLMSMTNRLNYSNSIVLNRVTSNMPYYTSSYHYQNNLSWCFLSSRSMRYVQGIRTTMTSASPITLTRAFPGMNRTSGFSQPTKEMCKPKHRIGTISQSSTIPSKITQSTDINQDRLLL